MDWYPLQRRVRHLSPGKAVLQQCDVRSSWRPRLPLRLLDRIRGSHVQECDQPLQPCILRQVRNVRGNGPNYGDFRCECNAGWTGEQCSVEIDQCALGVCKNYARCLKTKGNYTCFCRPGTSGRNCDVVPNSCLSAPCASGAVCEPSIFADSKCVCPAGKSGATCGDVAGQIYSLSKLSSIQVRSVSSSDLATISLSFRTLNPAGTLISHGTFALTVVGGDVLVSSGAAAVTIRAQNSGSFADGQWHTVSITAASASQRTVSVDGTSANIAYSSTAPQDVYIGDVPSNDVAGVAGCVKSVSFAGQALSTLAGVVFTKVSAGCPANEAFSFAGKSYVAYDASLAGSTSDITITFRTLAQQGRMLLAHQGVGNMLFSAYIDGGKLTFLLNLGRGSGELTLDYFVADGEWHTVTVSRARHIATIMVDNGVAAGTLRSLGNARNFVPIGPTYVGGNKKGSLDLVTGAPGFIGCISDVVINGNRMQVNSNGAVLLGVCSSAEIFSFGGNGYVQDATYSPKYGGSIQLRFRASSPNGIIAYGINRAGTIRDYYIVELVGGKIRAAFDAGINGFAEGFSGSNLADGQWHSLTYSRTNNDAMITVDGSAVAFHATGTAALLNIDAPFFLGGHPDVANGPARGSQSGVGFSGCISNVIVGARAAINGDAPTIRVNTLVGCPALQNDMSLVPQSMAAFNALPATSNGASSLRFAIRATFSVNTRPNQNVATAVAANGDSISIKFTNFAISVSASVGGASSSVQITNRPFVVDGMWHSVSLAIVGGKLQINVDDVATGSLNVSSFSPISLTFGSDTLEACIRDVTVNGQRLTAQSAALTGEVSSGCSAATGVYF
eukprot:Opistho-2@32286